MLDRFSVNPKQQPASAEPVRKRYDAFISYSVRDYTSPMRVQLAQVIRDALLELARPRDAPRALEVFLDTTGLTVTPDLWGEIQHALDRANKFVVLASPPTANSDWVGQEIEYWIATRGADGIVLVLTDGVIAWDSRRGGFDRAASTAIHPALWDVFPAEPSFVDLSGLPEDRAPSLRQPHFQEAMIRLAAVLGDRSVAAVRQDDRRERRRSARQTGITVSVLAVLAAVVVVAAAGFVWGAFEASAQRELTVRQRAQAEEQRDRASAQALSAQAVGPGAGGSDLRLLMAIQAVRIAATGTTLQTLHQLVDNDIEGFLYADGNRLTDVAISADGRRIAAVDATGATRAWDTQTRTLLFGPIGERGSVVEWSDDGTVLMLVDIDEQVCFYDDTGDQLGQPLLTGHRTLDVPSGPFGSWDARAAFDPSGTLVALDHPTENAVQIWHRVTRQVIGRFPYPADGYGSGLDHLMFAETGRLVLNSELIDVASGARSAIPPFHGPQCATISQDIHGPVGYDPTYGRYVFGGDHEIFVQPYRADYGGIPTAPGLRICREDAEMLRLTVPGTPSAIDVAGDGLIVAGTTSGLLVLARYGRTVPGAGQAREAQLVQACRTAGRNLTPAEWTVLLPDRPYEKTCPEFEAVR